MTTHYANGQFTDNPTDWPGWIWQTYGDTGEGSFTRAGYSRVERLGTEYLLSVTLYEYNREQRPAWLPPFFIDVDHGFGAEFISAATFGDAMDLLARWAPVATASMLTEAYENVLGSTQGSLIELLATVKAAKGQITARTAGIRAEEAERRRRKAQPLHLAVVTAAAWVKGTDKASPSRWTLTLRTDDDRELRTELAIVPDDISAMGTVFRALGALGIAVPPGTGPYYWQQGLTEDQVARQMTGRRVYVTDGGEITGAPPAAHP